MSLIFPSIKPTKITPCDLNSEELRHSLRQFASSMIRFGFVTERHHAAQNLIQGELRRGRIVKRKIGSALIQARLEQIFPFTSDNYSIDEIDLTETIS
jgi:hypothetical protein